jgi:mannosyltransferase OCH1-like enzyme
VLIPRTFHQIWLGPDPLPAEYLEHRRSWTTHHPGWTLEVWTEETLPGDLERKEIYELLRQPAERSDLLRFELLARYGGVYVDADFECLRSIEPLVDGAELFVGYRKPGRVNNALLGAVPGHPLVERAIQEIAPRTTYGPVDKDATGPGFLGRLLDGQPGVTFFEPGVFYPRTVEEREGAYAVHHQARSWKDTEGLRRSLRKADQRLLAAREQARQWRLRYEEAQAELVRLRERSRT